MTDDTAQTTAQEAHLLVPLSKLVAHDDNVRRTDKRADIESLAASIAAHGLLQNLAVVARDDGRYGVIAGSRRLAALRLLAKRGALARDAMIACSLVEASLGAEASLAENVQRTAMNPMDEMEAFVRLADGGMSIEDIAKRFGAGERHVEQRLALGRLSPKLRAAYRKAEITLDVARAFCLTDDHSLQERLLKQFGKPITHAASIRSALSGGRLSVTDRLVRFVGLEAYEAAGGRVTRDLFAEDIAFVEDGDLLQRLVLGRAELLRENLSAEGWGWTVLLLGHGQLEGCANERLNPRHRQPTSAEAETLAKIKAEIDALDAEIEDDEDNDALWRARDALDEQLEGLRAKLVTWDAREMAHAGAVVSIDQGGKPLITRGLIRRADLKTIRKLMKQAPPEARSHDDGSAPEADPVPRALPKVLAEDLTRARTRAVRAELSASPHVALALTVHILAQRSRHGASVAGAALTSRPIGFDDCDAFEQARVASNAASADDEAPDSFATLVAQPDEALLHLLALFIAETIDLTHAGVTPQDQALQAMSDALASALDLDIHRYWEASSEFWQRAPKAFILSALASMPPLADLPEAKRAAKLAALGKLKKPALAHEAAEALRKSAWLPDLLIAAPPGGFALTAQGHAALAADAGDDTDADADAA